MQIDVQAYIKSKHVPSRSQSFDPVIYAVTYGRELADNAGPCIPLLRTYSHAADSY